MNMVSGTGFANETHQLLVSVSRHLYISKSGVVKYQEKPMEVDIGNFHRSRKEHLVYYVLRDVFSGNFIFAVATTREMLPLLDFLHFGWKKDKEEDYFWGLPQNLSVPKRVSSPELITGLRQLKVEPFHPPSGFASGIRIIRDLEENLCFYALGRSAIHSLDTVQNCKSSVYRFMLKGAGKINRINLWRNSLPPGHPRDMPEYQVFRDLFPIPEKEKPGLRLFGLPEGGSAAKTKPRLPDFLDSPIESSKFSRPYMRALSGLAECLWKKGRREEALNIYWEMLRLNPNDNQGIRYQLGFRLLDQERYKELEKLFRAYHEASCFMLYNLALCRFCCNAGIADKTLRRALRANKHVPVYLLEEENVPSRQPDYYSPGREDEAAIYAGEAGAAWRKSPGALDWLRDIRSAFQNAKPAQTADPNIARLLRDFLEEQAGRLGNNTLRKYQFALEMMQACLENYGHTLLDDAEEQMLEDYQEGNDSEEEFPFSHLFGPEKIPGIINEFLGYFMVRKVVCGKDQLRATGTAIKKLAGWLAARGYITAGEAEDMAATAAEASRDLPAADELSKLLFDFVENSPPAWGEEELHDLFLVVKVEPGKLHLQAGAEEPVVVAVTQKISSLCKKDWMLSLLLVKTEQGWRIAESGTVYPI